MALENSVARNRALLSAAGTATSLIAVGDLAEKLERIKSVLEPRQEAQQHQKKVGALTNLGHQLNRLRPALSGRERAILELRNFKEGKPQDPSLAGGMSNHDHGEYNRLIDVMNACNCEIGTLILLVSRGVESLQLREAWLLTLQVWQLNLAEIDFAVTSLLKERITESEHEALKEADGRKYAPVDKLATIVAIEQRAWKDEDLEQVEWSGDSVVKDKAWKRLQTDAEAQLRQAVADAT